MSVDYADGSYFGGNVATEIGENVFNPGGETVSKTGGDGAFLGEGVRSGIDSWDKAYTNAGGKLSSGFGLSDLKKFVTDNKAFITGAGALVSAYGGGTNADKKTGYQGVIPTLAASRSMIAAPPTRAQGYRPGAGGIDYGGDVSYRLAPGMDPYANLSGTSGSAAGANLTTPGGTTPGGLTTIAGGTTAGGTKVVSGGTGLTTVKGGTGTDTLKGGTGNDTITGGTGNNTVKGGTGNDVITTSNLGSAGYQAAIKAGLTPAQYLNNINQWLIDNPRASKAQIDAAMKQFGVSQTDLQEALRTTTFSDYTKYGLTHGMGLQELNFAISDWVSKHPYATNKEIQDAMKAAGVNDADIARGLNGLSASAGKEYAIINDMGLDQLYKNILDYQAAGHSPAEVAAALAATGLDQRDINAANKFATEMKYTANPTSAAATVNYLPNNTVVQSPVAQSPVVNTVADAVATPTKVADVVQAASTPTAVQNTAPDNSSKMNEIYQYFSDPSTQAALASGDTRGIAETMQALGYSPAEVAQATGTNVADVQAAYDAALNQDNSYMQYAQGGKIAMAKGRYLQGETDGMADKLPAQIGQDQPAALSHGEFVIPADVVSHMGNGNSDAGAKKLYQMMDKIRMARTGTKKQGKRINPDKFMPGGLAQAYANGGAVKKFAGETDSLVTANRNSNMGISGVESNLSNWAGPYVTNMLGQGQALANMPYQAYLGQLTAGESPLQTGAFNTASNLQTPSSIGTAATNAGAIGTAAQGLKYTPTTTSFDAAQAQNYMNPYLQASLNPQLEEARRQSQITQQGNAAKMTQAGAFGGSRQAILDAETQRNLGTNLANITGTGYANAYDKATQQFNADQARKMQEAQYGAGFGLQGLQTGLQAAQAQGGLGVQQNQADINNLNAQLTAGAQQRGIESEGIAADKAQFEEARANPYKMVQYQQSLLQGLPLAAQSYQGIEPSALLKASQGATTVNALLKNLGLV
jgi:uncharacterized protein (DUF433 family)